MIHVLCHYEMAALLMKQSNFNYASVGTAALYLADNAIMLS
jgi:hypothetical protein